MMCIIILTSINHQADEEWLLFGYVYFIKRNVDEETLLDTAEKTGTITVLSDSNTESIQTLFRYLIQLDS